MIRFLYPDLLWLLALVPLLMLWRGRAGATPAIRYSSVASARALGAKSRSRIGRIFLSLRWPAMTLLILAIARPQFGRSTTETQASGIDLMLAVDVSGSMASLDFKVDGKPANRLDVVKSVVAKFIEQRPNDRIGLIAFSGAPYLVSPLTLDHDWLLTNLQRLHNGMMEDGTAIGSALAMSTERLVEQSGKSKIVVLLTDGMNNAGKANPEVAADAARALGVKVYTIGAGAKGEAPFPVTDARGTHLEMIKTDVDEPTLQAIATKTGGAFFRATNTASLARLYDDIDHMEKTTRTFKHVDDYSDRFAWLALAALLLLIADAGFGLRRAMRVP